MMFMKRGILRLLGILAIFLMFLTFPTPATAHAPTRMDLTYSAGVLNVTIYHSVASPDILGHYIESVQVYVNDGLEIEETYTTQPAMVAYFTYSYNVTAWPGDTIEVLATCSVGGTANETLVVPSGILPLVVSVETSSSEVEANRDVQVTVNVGSDDSGVEDADIDPSSDNGGTFSDFEDIGGGEYTATFTAPDVTAATTVTITVKVTKAGHTSAEDSVEITVKASSGGGGGGDDDDGLPGFETAGLLVGLVAVALIVAFRKRRLK
jgi:hypothetical protein